MPYPWNPEEGKFHSKEAFVNNLKLMSDDAVRLDLKRTEESIEFFEARLKQLKLERKILDDELFMRENGEGG